MDPRSGCESAFAIRSELVEEISRTHVSNRSAISESAEQGATSHSRTFASQRAIADYLDRETARIDALIEAKRRMVELLEERRRACVTRILRVPRWRLMRLLARSMATGVLVPEFV